MAPSGELASPLAVAGERLRELVATPAPLLLLVLAVGDSDWLVVGVAAPPAWWFSEWRLRDLASQ